MKPYALCLIFISSITVADTGKLQIHYINVGQGGANLIVGPNGTTILYDFGPKSGRKRLVPYLQNKAKINPADGLDYTIISHRHTDHYVGFKDLIDKFKYDVRIANYGPGKPPLAAGKLARNWLEPATRTSAHRVREIPVGSSIVLGNGAELWVVAADGQLMDGSKIEVDDENDRSVVLFISYGSFQYILDGDLGGGPEACSNHVTQQTNVQEHVAQMLLKMNWITPACGLDAMHVAHHGSESSTPASYYNLVKPTLALISAGPHGAYHHPRVDVVERILTQNIPSECVITAPPVKAVYQTEHGTAGCLNNDEDKCTSIRAKVVGDFYLETDGIGEMTVVYWEQNNLHRDVYELDELNKACNI